MRGTARRFGLPALWRWWLGELASLLPRGLRTATQRRRLRPLLVIGSDVAALRVPRSTNGTLGFAEVARIPLTGDPAAVASAGRAAIDSLARFAYGGAVATTKVVVVLPRDQVLRKTLALPAMVEDSLRQTLTYDLDRHTPFKADEVYFDAVVVARDPTRKELRVDWAAALRSVVDSARRRAEAWGATVVGIWPEMPDGAAPLAISRLNLLPAAERPESAGWRRWQLVAPVVLLLALAFVAVALPLWQKRSQALALTQLVEQAHVQANASDALRQQLDQFVGDYNFALQRKYAFPSAVQVLDDVTRILPDDTWLTQLEVRTPPKGKELRRDILLRGESANAGHLVALLEESKLFAEAAPRSPTTKIQPGPGEIFDLGAQLKPLAPPALVQLSSLPKPGPKTETEARAPAPAAAIPSAAATNPPAATTAPAATNAPAAAARAAATRQTPADAAQVEGATPADASDDVRAPALPGEPMTGSAPAPVQTAVPGADTAPAAVAPAAQPERGRRGGRARAGRTATP